MPLYNFKCESCTELFEYFGYLEDDFGCPKCESKKLKKLMSNAAVIFPIGDIEFSSTKNRMANGLYHDEGHKEKSKSKEISGAMAYSNKKNYSVGGANE